MLALHHICVRLERYCYVRVLDSRLEQLFGYANGESWAATPEEIESYPSRVAIQVRLSSPEQIFRRLQNETAHLVLLNNLGDLPTNGIAWLPWSLPLRQRAPPDGHATHGGGGGGGGGGGRGSRLPPFDRCFCRYVTQPRFGAAPSAAAAANAARVLASESGAALHLRTGYADVGEAEMRALRLSAGAADRRPFEETRRWYGAACDQARSPARHPSLFSTRGRRLPTPRLAVNRAVCGQALIGRLGSSLVLSDSPRVLAYARLVSPWLFAAEGAAAHRIAP